MSALRAKLRFLSPVLRRALLALAVLVSLVVARSAAAGDPLPPKDVPEPLKPWVGWVLDGKEEAFCATFQGHGDTSRCAWPSRLELALDEHGGRFSQTWHAEVKEWVPLPGDEKRWPADVKVGGARAAVVLREGGPSVLIEKGDSVVSGSFAWDSIPDSLHVPPETGLLALTLRGARVTSPNRDMQGTVWLQKIASDEEGNALELVVHRKVTDDIPLVLTTRIELHVSGKSREELLGKALPDGFIPMSLQGDLPARLEHDGRVRVQVRPGVFVIELAARSEGPLTKLTRPAPDGVWREGEEVWVFEAKNDYRIVTVGGGQSIDPQQTTLPDAWKRLPAYAMKVGDALTFAETRRGDADPPPNQLTLARTLWLDFAGHGLTASDTITGSLTRDARLTMAAPTVLGRVAIDGKDQFITHLADPNVTGVEVRQGTLNVSADSRIPGDPSDIPAVGWAHDFHQVTGTLHLPPGWRLFYASGVDEVPGTWVRHWSLLELFLALVVALGIGKLYGPRWGFVALATTVLTFPEDDAPKWIWTTVLAAEAIYRVLPGGRVKSFFTWVRGGAAVVVAVIAIPFLVQNVRQGMYPALERPGAVAGDLALVHAGLGGRPASVPAAALPAAPSLVAQNQPEPAGGDARQAADDLVAQVATGNAPPPPNAPMSKLSVARRSPAPRAGTYGQEQANAQVYDPAAIVQTGPGLPRWDWQSLPLRWSGPVAAGQRLHLYVLSPGENLVLAFLRAALLVLVLARVVPWTARFFPSGWGPPGWGPGAVAIVGAVLVTLAPHAARADTPSTEILNELRARLVREPECLPSCASSARMAVDARSGRLRIRLEVDAAALTAVPLPGSTAQWSPSEVLLDGAPAKGLARLADGTLWIELPAGLHQIALDGPLPDGASMQLALPLKSHRVEATSEGWEIAGIHEDGLADDNLQLTRVEPQQGEGVALQPGELPPFVRVERTLQVGLNWQVETHVVRVTPVGSAIVLEVPLLPGESVTTADVRVVGGKAQVNLGPQVTEASWRSVLEQKSPLKLVAPKSVAWTEVWRADVGPVWHATYDGIPFVHTEPKGGARIPEWRPWPGEEASVALIRPDGVPGQTLTIDQSQIDVTPGLRAADVTLSFSVRSSRGAQHTITLPPDAQLESLTIDGATQPIRQDGRKVTVPVVPGAQSAVVVWRETPGISTFFTVPVVDLGAPSVNATTVLHVPAGRWLLFTAGPRMGPAVLFWSLLLVLVVVSIALGRNRSTPLRTWQWLLLSIGLAQVDVIAGAVVVGWLLALGWRSWHLGETLSAFWFDARQIFLVVWTGVALVLLFVAVERGLLGTPEMQVSGNDSSADTLRWFEDRSAGALTTPWMISVPLLVYRAAMLAWALWLARTLLACLRWGWGALTTGGGWKQRPPRRAPPPPPPYPPTAFPGAGRPPGADPGVR